MQQMGFSSIKNKQAHLLSHLFPSPLPLHSAPCWCAEADLRSQFRPEVCVCDISLLCCGLLSYWPSLQKKLSCCWPLSSGTGQRWGSVTEACRRRVSVPFQQAGKLASTLVSLTTQRSPAILETPTEMAVTGRMLIRWRRKTRAWSRSAFDWQGPCACDDLCQLSAAVLLKQSGILLAKWSTLN